ncbi:unnamed protein product [Polarella glacialis]|uniref:Uncharacterized protein n=1 Tax=Polarella glacialis TaxID=89957 RepID=A0A813E2Y0_POLGL|nr:unnamed protein product [Polarella glacialis]
MGWLAYTLRNNMNNNNNNNNNTAIENQSNNNRNKRKHRNNRNYQNNRNNKNNNNNNIIQDSLKENSSRCTQPSSSSGSRQGSEIAKKTESTAVLLTVLLAKLCMSYTD